MHALRTLVLCVLACLLFLTGDPACAQSSAGAGLGLTPASQVRDPRTAPESGGWLVLPPEDLNAVAGLLGVSASTNPLWSGLDFSIDPPGPGIASPAATGVQEALETPRAEPLRRRLLAAYLPQTLYVVHKGRGGAGADLLVCLRGDEAVMVAETEGGFAAVSPACTGGEIYEALTEVLGLAEGAVVVRAPRFLDAELVFLLRALLELRGTVVGAAGDAGGNLAGYFSPDEVARKLAGPGFQRLLDLMPPSRRLRLQAMTVSRQVVSVALRVALEQGFAGRIVVQGLPRYGLSRSGSWLAEALFAPDWRVDASCVRLDPDAPAAYPATPGAFTLSGVGNLVLISGLRANGIVETLHEETLGPGALAAACDHYFR